ncbi:MAG TPA: hypothetical protein VL147_00975 [Devosia sp.]|nr:hypothetical protein [Devosia sp.]
MLRSIIDVQSFSIHHSVVLTAMIVIGLMLALAGTRLLTGEAGGLGSTLAYLAGGIPTGWRALRALWNEHEFDIDLPMMMKLPLPLRHPHRRHRDRYRW